MTQAHHRKKRPESVRKQILEAAVRILVRRGGRMLTLDAVAEQAGITKGGLIHHFSSRDVLVHGMFDFLREHFEKALELLMNEDPEPVGRFARAYLRTTLQSVRFDLESDGMPVYIAVMAEPELKSRVQDWFRRKYKQYARSDASQVDAEIVRFATDGIWLSEVFAEKRISDRLRKKIVEKLIEMTYPEKGR